jgi:hypothetical protein
LECWVKRNAGFECLILSLVSRFGHSFPCVMAAKAGIYSSWNFRFRDGLANVTSNLRYVFLGTYQPLSETHHSSTPSLHHYISTPLRLPRRRDVAFAETVESHRGVVEHFSFKFIGEILARF